MASSFAVPVVYAVGTVPDKMKIMELPIYESLPAKEQYEFVPHEPNSLEKGIGSVRTFLVEYKQSVESVVDKASHKWEVSKAHTLNLIDYIQNDPSILPRLGIITVAGLGGVVAGYRRGVIRKLTYSTIGLTSAACLCYPNQVSNVAKYSAGVVTNQSKNLWKKITAPPAVEPELPKSEKEIPATVESKVEETTSGTTELITAPAALPFVQVAIEAPPTQMSQEESVEPSKDFGQSSKEDNDLYTTRG